ncbi:MAG: Cupin domain protein [Methanosaeta sp. PtaB.Bin039]|nr:MAG: Cupin domain protein [Methanosaeta sp. PtaB.Bin039]HOT06641.1 cupin domain-containing protein [Methanotrichaceae archaeon]HQF16669.1 cupin domain-containing protein [Methanotrichaceae archaeon]HQI91319.1 cupin domain-containing protein [Methanotrichaceae archaeon]HQJ28733.1 cupin domain-containing protein [Methanotrichaceae archaeon]
MKITPVASAVSKPNPHGVDARKIYDSQAGEVMHLMLEPGQEMKKHVTPVDVFFYVLEGTGTVEIGDEQREVGPDTLVESPKGIPHRWLNNSEGRVRVLVAKLPKPSEKTRML